MISDIILLIRVHKERAFSFICLIIIGILLMSPTGFEKQIYRNAEHVRAKVLETNESTVYSNGLLRQGEQVCEIELLNGSLKGEVVEGVNMLTGSLERDKLFKVGDEALILLEKNDAGEFLYANMLDYYRLHLEALLLIVFLGALLVFSGRVGIRTIISFVFSLLCMWKVLVPLLLQGYHPILVSLMIGLVMAIFTLLLVAGFTKKAYCAILGMGASSLVTVLMAIVFGRLFQIHGAVMYSSESLLYSGYQNLDLTLIYQGAIYLSCSGALVDLSIDIAAAIEEIVAQNPTISRKAILTSGLNIGRSVVGSQATTLLLAYMGSFITIMMVYMAQGTPLLSILNDKSMASEVLHTLIGCLGLVIVSPLTTLICSIVYTGGRMSKENSLKV